MTKTTKPLVLDNLLSRKSGFAPGEMMIFVAMTSRSMITKLPDGRTLVSGEKSMWLLPRKTDAQRR